MSDPTYPFFSVFAFLGFILVLLPLPWHLKAWNSGTCFYMMWASLACLNQFVNSVIWHGNSLNSAPIWCEISIRIMMGASVGLPAASLCINRRLYHIITARAASISKNEKARAILVDTSVCVLFPLSYIALQYVVQGHRFNIYEDIGCFPAMYNALLFYFISGVWPLVIGCISAVYCALTLYTFSRRRIEFTRILASHPSITVWRYFRLMALAMADLLCTVPLSAFVIWWNATARPIEPWISWEDTHFNFSRVEQIPGILWRRDHTLVVAMEFTRWVVPFSSFVFVLFFGFAEEARKNYSTAFSKVCGILSFGGYTDFRSFLGFRPEKTKIDQFLPSLPLPVLSKSPYPPCSSMLSTKNDASVTSPPPTWEVALATSGHRSDSSSIRTCPW